jgi:hypothetical protein
VAYRVSQGAGYLASWSSVVLWQLEYHLLGKELGVSCENQAH